MKAEMEPGDVLCIIGQVLPPARTNKEEELAYGEFTHDQMKKMNLTNLELRNDHEQAGRTVGTIVTQIIGDPDCALYLIAYVTDVETGNKVMSGELGGLSLTHIYKEVRHDSISYQSRLLKEVTICVEGLRDGCTINSWKLNKANK